MGDPAGEERMPAHRSVAHMGVEDVAGEMREMLDVLDRDDALARAEAAADLQILKGEPERMGVALDERRPPDPLAGEAGEEGGGALEGRALQVGAQAAHPAEFLAAARPARPAMDEVRQGRAVARLLRRAVPVDHQQPAVEGGQAEDEVGGDARIMRVEGGDEAALAAIGERLQHRGALVEGEAAQGRATDTAGMIEHRLHGDPAARHLGDRLARDGAAHQHAILAGRGSAPLDVALQLHGASSPDSLMRIIDRPDGWSSSRPKAVRPDRESPNG